MLSSIVVGIDFTPSSAVALGQALRIAAASSAALRVVHVIDELVVSDLEQALAGAGADLRCGVIADAQAAWSSFAADLPGAAALRLEVAVDHRVAGLLRLVEAARADLLVLGAFGTRHPDVGVGTVASACVRKSAADVLLVRDTQTGPFRKIVAAVDFSDTSRRALERAAYFAARDGAELSALHVFDPPWDRLHYRAPTPQATPQLQKQFRDALERRLGAFCEAARAAIAPSALTTTILAASAHRSEISRYAQDVGADLIVLGTRGRTNLRDLLLGSTAEKVLQESDCSLLAVKPEGFRHPLASAEPAGAPADDV